MSTKAENKAPKETKSHKKQVLLFGSLGIVVGAGLALASYDTFLKVEEMMTNHIQPPEAQVKEVVQPEPIEIELSKEGVPSFVSAMVESSKDIELLKKRLTDLELNLQKVSEKEVVIPQAVSMTIPQNIQQTPIRVELLLALQSIHMGQASGEWLQQIAEQVEEPALKQAISATAAAFVTPKVTEVDLLSLLESVQEEKEPVVEEVVENEEQEPQTWQEKALDFASQYVKVSKVKGASGDTAFQEALASLKNTVALGDYAQAKQLVENTTFLNENASLKPFTENLEKALEQKESLEVLFDTLKGNGK